MKTCRRCGEEKSLDLFPKHPQCKDGHTNICKECTWSKDKNRSSRQKEWRNKNRDRYLEGLYFNGIKHKFNLSKEDYLRLFEQQNGVCAICGQPETRTYKGRIKRLSVDHDHITGEIRGLLCYKCNAGIGNFNDSKKLLSKAIVYISKLKD